MTDGAVDDPGTCRVAQRYRLVGAARINHDHLIGEGTMAQQVTDAVGFIERNNHDADIHLKFNPQDQVPLQGCYY